MSIRKLSLVGAVGLFAALAFTLGGCKQIEKYLNEPPTVSLSANPTSGPAPLTVTFTVNANDPDGDAISCTLDFGDQTTPATQCNGAVNHTYQQAGTYAAVFTAQDSKGKSSTTTTTVTVSTSGTSGGGGGSSNSIIAKWSFDSCNGQDESGNGHNLNGDFTGRCVTGVNGKSAATVVSTSPEIPCLHVPVIPELGSAQRLTFDFWFRFRSMSSWSNGILAHHGTALFSFGQGDTQGKAYFALFEYPEPDFSKAHMYLDFEDKAYGQGQSGVRSQTSDYIIADENYHHAVIKVDRQAGTASLYIDGNHVGDIQVTTDFNSLGNEPGYLGGLAWWGGTNSCSSASTGPRAIIDLDEFVIRY